MPAASVPPSAGSDPDPIRTAAGAEPQAEWIDLTPKLAEQLLESNTDNRPLSQARVDALVRDLQAGAWQVNGEAVKVCADGRVIDGQHRLWAVFNSGLTARTLIVRGLPWSARATVDRHRPRRDADDLQGFGSGTGRNRAAAVAKLIDLLLVGRARYITTAELAAMVARYQASIEWALGSCTGKLLSYAPTCGALAYASATSPQRVEAFVQAVKTGTGLEEGDPALALRNYLSDRDKVRADTRRVTALRVLRAVQAHLEGERLVRLASSEEALAFFRRVHEPAPPATPPRTRKAAQAEPDHREVRF